MRAFTWIFIGFGLGGAAGSIGGWYIGQNSDALEEPQSEEVVRVLSKDPSGETSVALEVLPPTKEEKWAELQGMLETPIFLSSASEVSRIGQLIGGIIDDDPDFAIQLVSDLPSNDAESYLSVLSGVLVDRFGLSSLNYVKSFAPGYQRRNALALMLQQLAVSEPDEMVKLLLDPDAAANVAVDPGTPVRLYLIQALASASPEHLTQVIPQLDGKGRLEAIHFVADRYGIRGDIATMLDWMEGLEDAEQIAATRYFLNRTAITEPEAAARVLDQLPEDFDRGSYVGIIMENWSRVDMVAALDWAIQGYDDQILNSALKDWAMSAGASAPDKAAEHLHKMPHGRGRDDAIRMIGSYWAAKDPEAAVEWLQSLGQADRNLVGGVVINAWGETDPEGAIAYLENNPGAMPSRGEGGGVPLHWIRRWALEDEDKAFAWANQSGRDDYVRISALALAQSNPQKALEQAANVIDLELRQSTIRDMLNMIADEDPKGAFDLFFNLPPGMESEKNLTLVATKWLNYSPERASSAIAEMPPSRQRDVAAESVVHYLLRKYEYQDGLAWASSIRDEQIRREWLKKAYDALSNSNPNGASQVLDDMDLPEKDRDFLIRSRP